MGILDDLAMGFGLKERTEDYDARTAKTIAMNEATSNAPNQQMATMMMSKLNSGGTISPSSAMYQGLNLGAFDEGTQPNMASIMASQRGPHRRFIASRGYDQGYTPSVGGTGPSATPYAIGPLTMDKPLNLMAFSPIGMFMNILSGGNRDVPTVSADTSPMRVRPQSGYNLGGNAQPGTRFDTRTEAEPIDYSDGILVQDPATIAAVEALNSVPDTPTLSSAPSILTDPTGELSAINNVDPVRPKDMGVDEYGRRVPVTLPKDPEYISGIDMEFPALSAPLLSEGSSASISLEDLPQGQPGVQLGAYDTVSDASAAYQRLINQNPQLSSYQPLIEKSKYGDREYYRLRVKGLDDISDARNLASSLTGVDAYSVYGRRVN